MLTSELRANGDLDIAAPPTMEPMDIDSKDPLSTPFTQKLQLFVCSPTSAISSFVVTITHHLQSQTPKGVRYCPNLTRFYTTAAPPTLLPLIQGALKELGVKCVLDQRWVLFCVWRLTGSSYTALLEREVGCLE